MVLAATNNIYNYVQNRKEAKNSYYPKVLLNCNERCDTLNSKFLRQILISVSLDHPAMIQKQQLQTLCHSSLISHNIFYDT